MRFFFCMVHWICLCIMWHTRLKYRAESRITNEICKILQTKSITVRCVKSKVFYCRLFWPKLHRNWDIMKLAYVAKLSEQRASFKNLLSFCLYSLLHGIIKTFVKSFTRFGFVQYKHTFSGHLEDINLLSKQSRKHFSNTTFFQSTHMYLRTLVGVIAQLNHLSFLWH